MSKHLHLCAWDLSKTCLCPVPCHSEMYCLARVCVHPTTGVYSPPPLKCVSLMITAQQHGGQMHSPHLPFTFTTHSPHQLPGSTSVEVDWTELKDPAPIRGAETSTEASWK